MQKKTMGSFMAALRKANGYTQQQIADKLNVSNKTVSKWECDDGCPEISMLPAIAEIYGITVDELLRGEKANDTTQKETNNQKTEEQIKYLCDKSFSKFNNGSIVALSLVLCSWIISFLPFIISDLTPYFNYSPVVFLLFIFIALAICIASLVVILTAFNNLVSHLNNNDFAEKPIVTEKFSKSINLISITIALAIATVFTLTGPIFFNFLSPLGEIPIIIFSGIIGFLVRFILRKKYSILNTDISLEKRKLRKKHTKITAILLSVIILLNLAGPFVEALANPNTYYYDFENCNYHYETIEDAERDYYKVKNHITSDKKLYDDDWVEDKSLRTGEYILEVDEIKYVFDFDSEKGYKLVGGNDLGVETFTFKTEEDREQFTKEFEKENVYKNDELTIDMLEKGVKFDDDTLTIRYQKNFTMSRVYEVAPAHFLLALCEISVVLIVMTIVYKKKTKNL